MRHLATRAVASAHAHGVRWLKAPLGTRTRGGTAKTAVPVRGDRRYRTTSSRRNARSVWSRDIRARTKHSSVAEHRGLQSLSGCALGISASISMSMDRDAVTGRTLSGTKESVHARAVRVVTKIVGRIRCNKSQSQPSRGVENGGMGTELTLPPNLSLGRECLHCIRRLVTEAKLKSQRLPGENDLGIETEEMSACQVLGVFAAQTDGPQQGVASSTASMSSTREHHTRHQRTEMPMRAECAICWILRLQLEHVLAETVDLEVKSMALRKGQIVAALTAWDLVTVRAASGLLDRDPPRAGCSRRSSLPDYSTISRNNLHDLGEACATSQVGESAVGVVRRDSHNNPHLLRKRPGKESLGVNQTTD
ncbi:hypothetical protein B0H14DRAFT_2591637 [Mycena olivaceomarginata]|nr:hypothetical protein B0H14DRAFT_2591637 [Mycena olivaceomarginata]